MVGQDHYGSWRNLSKSIYCSLFSEYSVQIIKKEKKKKKHAPLQDLVRKVYKRDFYSHGEFCKSSQISHV